MSDRIGIRAWIDFAFKKIFGKPGNEVCLISLLNSVLDLRKPVESVEFLNPFSLKEFEEAKLICVDVKATDTERRVFIVEVQMIVATSFAKRAVYYASKAMSDEAELKNRSLVQLQAMSAELRARILYRRQ
jgi:predicted transposase/invertase (TIGR01784 family)